jgi:hypothetical protein
LLKSVLESIPQYWLSLAHVPKSILDRIRRCSFQFPWYGKKLKESIALVKWKNIAKPKKDSGWGIKNIYLFGKALATKRLWRLLFNKGMWARIMQQKYIISHTMEQWIIAEPKSIRA